MTRGLSRTLAALTVLAASSIGRVSALDLDEIEKRGTLRVLAVGHLRPSASWSQLVVKYFGEQAPEVLRKARTETP